jgi:anthranilate synthase component 1
MDRNSPSKFLNSRKRLNFSLTPAELFFRVRTYFSNRGKPVCAIFDNRKTGTPRAGRSIICANPIASLRFFDSHLEESVNGKIEKIEYSSLSCKRQEILAHCLNSFADRLNSDSPFSTPVPGTPDYCRGFYGYTNYGAIELCEKISLQHSSQKPLAEYFLFGVVIECDSNSKELELSLTGCEFELEELLSERGASYLLTFETKSEVRSNLTDEQHAEAIAKCKEAILRGDVFQIVPSRRFSQEFKGDDFEVYTQLSKLNPSPYLFYFDLGEFRLFGSSPEAQLVVREGHAAINPIAGTYKRSGEYEVDVEAVRLLQEDKKELSEHVMLVDLARNDLSRFCHPVGVIKFREVQEYSHVFHLVSEVGGKLENSSNSLQVFAATFPAGTVSGAPKYRAMELINKIENCPRDFYAGSIGYFGFDGSIDQGIMIRTFHSESGVLTTQAGAGIVYDSVAEKEIAEVSHKLRALFTAVELASTAERV